MSSWACWRISKCEWSAIDATRSYGRVATVSLARLVVAYQFDAGPYAELAVDVRKGALHSGETHGQGGGDLPIGSAIQDVGDDPFLHGRQILTLASDRIQSSQFGVDPIQPAG
jgi:hypothetical protein